MENSKKRKKRLFLIFVISILGGTVLILSVMLINMTYTAESLAISLIDRTTDKARIELDKYFEPIIKNLKINRELCDQGVIDAENNSNINAIILPCFNQLQPLNTFLVADTLGNEYSIIREDTGWLSNIVYESEDSGMVLEREHWLGNINEHKSAEKWIEYNSDWDPRTRPWFIGAMTTERPDKVWWTDPYIFYTHQIPGITISLRSYCKSSGKYHVIQYDILLENISEFTTNTKVSEFGKIFVLSNKLKTIGLPDDYGSINNDSIRKYLMEDYDSVNSEILSNSVNKWKESEDNTKAYSFKFKKEKWWAKISEYKLGINNSFYIGVAVPEKDFLTEVNKTRNIVIAGFAVVMVFIIIIIRQNNIRRRTNILLAQQKEEIERQHKILVEQNKEITDSIEYAQQIQEALLPDDSFLKNVFSDHFVLLKPLHTVSGDFYWMKKIDDKVIIVAADCTGHGVPGAFMSMLGIAFLNEIVREQEVSKANNILEQLRLYVKNSLKQTETGKSKDGMDVALYVIELNTLNLHYSGAFNPLFIIFNAKNAEKRIKQFEDDRNFKIFRDESISNQAILEIKADRQPVAVYMREKKFSNYTIQLQKGDMLYSFSDGYQDQFGGEDGKKFKVRNMKRLLLKIHNEPMNKQKEILSETIIEYQAGYQQVDDILFLGVKI